MTAVTYSGPDDFRVLDSADFAKAGVEQAETLTFAKGVALKVTKAVSDALLADAKLFGKFEAAPAEAADKPADSADKAVAKSK